LRKRNNSAKNSTVCQKNNPTEKSFISFSTFFYFDPFDKKLTENCRQSLQSSVNGKLRRE
jgi:hypothetical protein